MMRNPLVLVLIISIVVMLIILCWRLLRGEGSGRMKGTDYTISYMTYLQAEYEALPAQIRQQGNQAVIDRILQKGESVTWDDLFTLELLILQILPPEKLRRKAWLMRARYREIAGERGFDTYLHSLPPEPTATHPDDDTRPPILRAQQQLEETRLLRADLEVLLEDIYWLYRIRTEWERRRNWFSKMLGWLYGGIALVGVLLLLLLTFAPDITRRWEMVLTVVAVSVSGALGGFMSMLRRLQTVSADGNRLLHLIEMQHGRNSILFQSIISGSIFAVVLLLIFIGGFIQGELFPDLRALTTLDPLELAKLLVWSFIAGFAERLVPDFLDRFIARASDDQKKG